MAQQIKVPAAISDGLSSIPYTYMVEKRELIPIGLFCDLHSFTVAHILSPAK